jgi:ribosomal protein S18 acetylase RimI-like enzyme
MKIDFRNAKEQDIPAIAVLCSDVFDGPFEWFKEIQKQKSINDFSKQLSERFSNLVTKGMKHGMIVATDSEAGNKLVAFLEIGSLPSPVTETAEWQGGVAQVRPDVPYLGNVAVSGDYRRQGLGSKLVKIGKRMAEKWGEKKLYVAVDSTNGPAIAMYEKLNFVKVLDESDNINRRADKTPRLFMAIDCATTKPAATNTSS